jgi:16S rRNA G966 N2-methylase RsmD
MLNKLFPKTDYTKIQFDKEGLYSITEYYQADIISELILNNYINKENLSILDGTGGLGGNTISFSKFFKTVTSIELNINRYKMLLNNINIYNIKNINILNEDSIKYMFKNITKYDIFFFDPPWGGPNYKKIKNIRLTLSNYTLEYITNYTLKYITNKLLLSNKLLIFKLPRNYDFSEFNKFNYKLYKLYKYFLIIILL